MTCLERFPFEVKENLHSHEKKIVKLRQTRGKKYILPGNLFKNNKYMVLIQNYLY